MCDCQLTGSIRSAYNYNDIERHSDVPGQGCGHGWPDHPPGAGHRWDRGLLPWDWPQWAAPGPPEDADGAQPPQLLQMPLQWVRMRQHKMVITLSMMQMIALTWPTPLTWCPLRRMTPQRQMWRWSGSTLRMSCLKSHTMMRVMVSSSADINPASAIFVQCRKIILRLPSPGRGNSGGALRQAVQRQELQMFYKDYFLRGMLRRHLRKSGSCILTTRQTLCLSMIGVRTTDWWGVIHWYEERHVQYLLHNLRVHPHLPHSVLLDLQNGGDHVRRQAGRHGQYRLNKCYISDKNSIYYTQSDFYINRILFPF